MSDQYKKYLDSVRQSEVKRIEIIRQLQECEKQQESLRADYSKTCDHPTRVLQFPVCGICYKFVANSQ